MPRRPDDATHTKSIRKGYEAALVKSFRKFKREVLEIFRANIKLADAWEGGSLPDRRFLQSKYAINLNLLDDEIVRAKTGILMYEGNRAIDRYLPPSLFKGFREGERLTDIEHGGLGEADYRALDSLKVSNLAQLKLLSDELSAKIVIEVSNGISNGLPIYEIADNIADRVDKIGISRARLIARTEVIKAYNEGTGIRLQQAGKKAWEWRASRNEMTCPFCSDLDGRSFLFSDRTSPFPPLHPNCACGMLASRLDPATAVGKDAWNPPFSSVETRQALVKRRLKRETKERAEVKESWKLPENRPNHKARNATLMKWENRRIHNDFETGALFDPKGGELVSVVGGNDYVDWGNVKDDYEFKGKILTHNHPKSRAFSIDDISVAHNMQLREIRATTLKGTYRFYRDDYMPFKYDDYSETISSIYVVEGNKQKDEWGKLIKEGKLTVEDADERHARVLWGKVVTKVNHADHIKGRGFKYVFELEEWE
jgi:SPP1 gp7 family putative phage head morphogenesis protein